MKIPENCQKCQNLCVSRTQIVYPDHPERSMDFKLLVVGEAPGADEDKSGRGFMGRAGRTLHAMLASEGLTRGRDYGCANIIRCRPENNRRPTSTEIANCFPYLLEWIEQVKPQYILTVGESATKAFTGHSGLLSNIQKLKKQDYNPKHFFEHGGMLETKWPHETRLFAIPHTSPLAWNRNASNGKKWSVIGREEVHIMAQEIKTLLKK